MWASGKIRFVYKTKTKQPSWNNSRGYWLLAIKLKVYMYVLSINELLTKPIRTVHKTRLDIFKLSDLSNMSPAKALLIGSDWAAAALTGNMSVNTVDSSSTVCLDVAPVGRSWFTKVQNNSMINIYKVTVTCRVMNVHTSIFNEERWINQKSNSNK